MDTFPRPNDIIERCAGVGTGDEILVTRDGRRWVRVFKQVPVTGVIYGIVRDGRIE